MAKKGYRNNVIDAYGNDDVSRANIPEGVVDTVAWDNYISTRKKFEEYLNENEFKKTSVVGVVVKINKSANHFRKYKEYLPDEEYEKYDKMRSRLASLRSKANQYKRKAYGVKPSFSRKKEDPSLSQSIMSSKFPQIIELFGRYFTIKEVHEKAVKDWGLEVTVNMLESVYNENIEDIKRRRDEYSKDFSNVRLSHKRSRIDELSYMYKRRKDKFDEGGNYSVVDSREMRAIIEQIRKETEGDSLSINADIAVKNEKAMELHVHNIIMNNMSIKQLIVGRAAARLGVSSHALIERLMSSMYSKFTGFAKVTRDEDNDEMIYPSQIMYEFDEVIKGADSKRVSDKKVNELPKSEKKEYSDIKIKAVRKILDKTNSMSKGKKSVDGSGNLDKI